MSSLETYNILINLIKKEKPRFIEINMDQTGFNPDINVTIRFDIESEKKIVCYVNNINEFISIISSDEKLCIITGSSSSQIASPFGVITIFNLYENHNTIEIKELRMNETFLILTNISNNMKNNILFNTCQILCDEKYLKYYYRFFNNNSICFYTIDDLKSFYKFCKKFEPETNKTLDCLLKYANSKSPALAKEMQFENI